MQWPELMPFLTQTCQSPTATQRESAVFVLYTIWDTVRETFINEMMNGMFQIFGTTLGDQDASVRLITLRALGKIAEYIESDQKDLIVSNVSSFGCRFYNTLMCDDVHFSETIPSDHAPHASSAAADSRCRRGRGRQAGL